MSTHWQIDKDSLPVQREELCNYCKYALNLDSFEIFEDAGYSAKNTERPAYQQMMARLRTGEFSQLYGEEAITEKDYLIERKRMNDDLAAIDARIETLEKNRTSQLSITDDNFFTRASYFILSQQLTDKREVDYDKYIRKIDPRIVKNFLNEIVQNFCIKDGRIESIRFKNGIEHRFLYNSSED